MTPELPPTFVPLPPAAGVTRPRVFDPALKQYRQAFRHGEPAFADPAVRAGWLAARRRAVEHVLQSLAADPVREQLVLRGSALLPGWLGEDAREPGDLDFVVTPQTVNPGTADGKSLTVNVARAVTATTPPWLDWEKVRCADIWTYERAPGRRLVLPWRAVGLPAGVVQMDFVFGEELDGPPAEAEVGGARLRAATPHQSLAWKLQWLRDDMHPQAKDLYDAVLLAERFGPPPGRTWYTFDPLTLRTRDWADFTAEYPQVAGTLADWQRRLAAALA